MNTAYKMVPVTKFWKEWNKGNYQDECKTLILVERDGGLCQDFAFVMKGFFDHPRGINYNGTVKFVLVKRTKAVKK